ncbi:MAG: hypothetical protein ACKOJF_19645, partial [Planctomycetaceae bacterium]
MKHWLRISIWGMGLLALGGGAWFWADLAAAPSAGSASAARGQPVEARPEPGEAGAAGPATVCAPGATAPEYSPELVERVIAEARAGGVAARGAVLFGSSHLACLSCHRVGETGGQAGPDLGDEGRRRKPAEIVESVLWPARDVPQEYTTWVVETEDGKVHKGYRHKLSPTELTLRDPALGTLTVIPRQAVESERAVGTLMPEGLTSALTVTQRRDLVRFLLELGHDPRLPGL